MPYHFLKTIGSIGITTFFCLYTSLCLARPEPPEFLDQLFVNTKARHWLFEGICNELLSSHQLIQRSQILAQQKVITKGEGLGDILFHYLLHSKTKPLEASRFLIEFRTEYYHYLVTHTPNQTQLNISAREGTDSWDHHHDNPPYSGDKIKLERMAESESIYFLDIQLSTKKCLVDIIIPGFGKAKVEAFDHYWIVIPKSGLDAVVFKVLVTENGVPIAYNQRTKQFESTPEAAQVFGLVTFGFVDADQKRIVAPPWNSSIKRKSDFGMDLILAAEGIDLNQSTQK